MHHHPLHFNISNKKKKGKERKKRKGKERKKIKGKKREKEKKGKRERKRKRKGKRKEEEKRYTTRELIIMRVYLVVHHVSGESNVGLSCSHCLNHLGFVQWQERFWKLLKTRNN